MAKVMITQAKLEALADALRAKLGFTGKKTLAQLTQAVSDFDTGTDTSDATGGAAQMLQGYTAYGAGGKFTGSIQSLGAQTFQPSTSDQTIPAGKYLSGAQKIAKMVLQEKVVTLSTSQQVLTPPVGVHGFSKVTVPAAGDYFVDEIPEGSFTVGLSGKQVTVPLSRAPASLRDSFVLVHTSSNEAGAIINASLTYKNGYGSFYDNGAVLTTSGGNIAAVISLPEITGTISGNNLTLNIASGTPSGYSPIFGEYGRIIVIYKA